MISFVDRDMLMRYLGGGVGHTHQNRAVPTDDKMDVDGDSPEGEAEGVESGVIEADPDNEDDEDDAMGYSYNEEGDDSSGDEDDDLGPEDGEIDIEDDGYGVL